jgi:hypothetical protein
MAPSTLLYWSAGMGLFLGFSLGMGCSLAVMFSIYMGGYRAAIRDSQRPEAPERYVTELKKFNASQNDTKKG